MHDEPTPIFRIENADPAETTLAWRWLWRGVRPALNPVCWAGATVVLVLVDLWGAISLLWREPGTPSATDRFGAWLSDLPAVAADAALNPGSMDGTVGALLAGIAGYLRAHPFEAILIGLPSLALIAIVLLAGARGAALVLTGRSSSSRPETDVIARRAWSAIFAVVVPVVLIAVELMIVVFLVWLGSALAWMQGLAMFGASAVGVLGVVGAILFVLVGPMIPAAIAVEDADAIEAVQRVVAYAIGNPVRTVLAWLVTFAGGAVLVGVASAVLLGAAGLAETLLATMNGPDVALPSEANGPWRGLAVLLVAGLWLSYLSTGPVAMYLWLRERIDGQDHTDLGADPFRIPPPSASADPAGSAAGAPDTADRAGGRV